MKKYDFKKIEAKWQDKWLEERVFRADDKSKKPKFYQLETFPYPSADGLHVGHPKGYIAEDIHARYMRMRGKEVLYTIGWDAFGLPTENYAIKVGKAPKDVAEANVKNFKRQVQMFGLSYDWDREINTSSPEYYKWTQWLFIQLFKKGLAYKAKAKVNWCPSCNTVLANEQVIGQDGKDVCERCKSEVEQREMEQWFLKITDYAERLLKDLEKLDWPEATIKRQEDWIGKSEGAEIEFRIANKELGIKVFTTRPDTLFGATYLVLAPEYEFLVNNELGVRNYEEVKKYIEKAKNKKELDRISGWGDSSTGSGQGKTGVELEGVKAINPASGEEIPIWVADYVLGSYGTGAIMAVPAHDERDYEFAKKFKLPIKAVIMPRDQVVAHSSDGEYISIKDFSKKYGIEATKIVIDGISKVLTMSPTVNEGILINSGKFDGMDSEKAKWEITKFVKGKRKTQYKLRDWSVSRQRYWGVPIPMINCKKCGVLPVPDKDLPVILPDLKDYRPKGMPPLESSYKFIDVKCPKCGGDARREAETLDTFVDSSWYYLRYTDPHNDKKPFDKKKANHWMPVDLYVIGAEHTVLHLLYSRFITKFLKDEGYLGFEEPFSKLRHVGLIQGSDGQKMSKSRGNVVNPDELVSRVGADAVRVYEMFMGPFEQGQPWDTQGVLGAERFLARVWKFFTKLDARSKVLDEKNEEFERLLHKTIKKVGEDIESLSFNTAISALMILLNGAEKQPINKLRVKDLEIFIKLLYPFAPHMCEEIWHEVLDKKTYLHEEKWPKYESRNLQDDKFILVIQINGKVRDSLEIEANLSQGEVEKMALEREKVGLYLAGAKPKKVIYVSGRLINFVI